MRPPDISLPTFRGAFRFLQAGGSALQRWLDRDLPLAVPTGWYRRAVILQLMIRRWFIAFALFIAIRLLVPSSITETLVRGTGIEAWMNQHLGPVILCGDAGEVVEWYWWPFPLSWFEVRDPGQFPSYEVGSFWLVPFVLIASAFAAARYHRWAHRHGAA